MSLAAEYDRQYAFRDWPHVYEWLPPLAGVHVLDLGCAIGSQARDLASRGAQVTGVDGNADLLAIARERGGGHYERGDLRALPELGVFDGIWSSFAAAYFPDLAPVLRHWCERLVPGGWLALLEVDGLFLHEPLPGRWQQVFAGYVHEARTAGRYDFGMGGRLAENVRRAGLTVVREELVADRELCFDGPAGPDVLRGWGERLDRLRLLRERAGGDYDALRAHFVASLSDPGHRSLCRVRFCLARKP